MALVVVLGACTGKLESLHPYSRAETSCLSALGALYRRDRTHRKPSRQLFACN